MEILQTWVKGACGKSALRVGTIFMNITAITLLALDFLSVHGRFLLPRLYLFICFWHSRSPDIWWSQVSWLLAPFNFCRSPAMSAAQGSPSWKMAWHGSSLVLGRSALNGENSVGWTDGVFVSRTNFCSVLSGPQQFPKVEYTLGSSLQMCLHSRWFLICTLVCGKFIERM